MDGGVLSVPFDRLNQFNEKYIEAIRSGEKLFIVEQKSPTYNFFVDIDYKDTTSTLIWMKSRVFVKLFVTRSRDMVGRIV